MPMTPKEMTRLLKKDCFIEVKNNGGLHCKFYNHLTRKTIVIPFRNKDIGKGLEQAILKQAGLK